MALCATAVGAQEMLVPAGRWQQHRVATKSTASVSLPFFDDFSDYCGAPDGRHWEPGGAYVGVDYGPLPPTVGMMTLDALDADGRLYPQASTNAFPADTALSLPIRLDGLDSVDSVVMSFYYLPGGSGEHPWETVGDTPNTQDSLFLDFYSVADSAWHTVWSRCGTSAARLRQETGHDWQYVTIAITDSGYLDSLFRFRFRNHCSLIDNGVLGMAGNADQWNIDYVMIDRGRTVDSMGVFRDIAFVKPAPTMLKHYRAMPARQYRSSEMAQQLSMTIASIYSSSIASYYSYSIMDSSGAVLYTYDGGYQNAPPQGYQTEAVHATPSVGYSFPLSNDIRTYTIVHNVREGTSGDEYPQNDTVRYTQVFGNYYAYDDGTAENGYGVKTTGQAPSIACRFDLNEADTLTAVDIAFNRTMDDATETARFFLTVWSAENGQPGTVLYSDATARQPLWPDSASVANGHGAFRRFALEHDVVVDGSIFVGLRQGDNTFINIGFDRSRNSSDRMWQLSTMEWQQVYLSGSLMLRPCFGQAATIGIATVERDNVMITPYPNPADCQVTLGGIDAGSQVTVYDIQGRRVLTTTDNVINTASLPAGMYIVKAVTRTGTMHAAKLIIRH